MPPPRSAACHRPQSTGHIPGRRIHIISRDLDSFDLPSAVAGGLAAHCFCGSLPRKCAKWCRQEGSHPSSQIRVAAARRECTCRSRPLPRPIGATCRAPQAKYHPEHGNVVRDWERSQSRVKISMGGEEARHSWELLHHLLGCVVSYTSSSPGASAAREVFRWVRSREFL